MNVKNTLSVWSEACKNADIRWYLYRETLLCAVGYGYFPETLTCPQVAVFAKDLSALVQQVFPALPQNWTLDKLNFARDKYNLFFRDGETTVLELCVLCGAEDEAQIAQLNAKIKQAVRKVDQKQFWNKIRKLLPLYTKSAEKRTLCNLRTLTDQAFETIAALTGTPSKKATLYWDGLTNKEPVTLPADAFKSTVALTCDGADYPVFSGYQAYLTAVFSDYETGLHDEIGCGLTAEEKTELKEHQKRCIEALAALEKLSQQFGLCYYLLAGSVLGCVRHGGFIPWDDDIDIGIRIEERDQFQKVVKEQFDAFFPEGFTLMQAQADDPYPRMFSKICYDGRCCIDLWPLVPTYNNGMRAEFLWYFGKLITKVHLKKNGHKVNRFSKIVSVLEKFLTDKMTMRLAHYNERQYANKRTPAYINLYSIYTRSKETIQRAWLDEEVRLTFHGMQVPVVGCTEAYLTHLYGNYMEKPAPWKRASRHVTRFYPTDAIKKETEG